MVLILVTAATLNFAILCRYINFLKTIIYHTKVTKTILKWSTNNKIAASFKRVMGKSVGEKRLYLLPLYHQLNCYHVILIGAFLIRLLAAIFSQGYGMHDDHFLVLEASQSWVDGTDYNDWLPKSQVNPVPSGHSFFYVGIHFLILSTFKAVGIHNPKLLVFLIRLLHDFAANIVFAARWPNLRVSYGVGD